MAALKPSPKEGWLTVSAICCRRWSAPQLTHGSLPRSYSLPGSSASGLPPLCAATGQRLKSPKVSPPQVVPPSVEALATRPCDPPSLQRSCCQAPATLAPPGLAVLD